MPRRAYRDVSFDIRASPGVRGQYLATYEHLCDACFRSRAAPLPPTLPWQSADVFGHPVFIISTSRVQNGIARISNKLPRGTRLVRRLFPDKLNVIRHLRVPYESFLDPGEDKKSLAVAIGICAYQRFSGQDRELIFLLCVLARLQCGHCCQCIAGHWLSRSTVRRRECGCLQTCCRDSTVQSLSWRLIQSGRGRPRWDADRYR